MVKLKKPSPYFTPKQTNLQSVHAKINPNKRATYNILSFKNKKTKALSPVVTSEIKKHIDIIYIPSIWKWSYKRCDICGNEVSEVYTIGSHQFCNYGCISIYLTRVGGFEGDLLFDIAWRMY